MTQLIKKAIIFTFILALMCFICIGCTKKDLNVDLCKNEIQTKLDSLREASGFPGATLAFALPNGVKMQLATGLSDIEKNIKMKPSDRMFSGSQGKTYVATIALQMVDEGKLTLDDPVNKYLGDEEWFSRLPNHSLLTIRMLLNHTGGLPRYVFKESFWNDVNQSPDKTWKPEELLSYIFDESPVHPVSKGWAYSDTDYIVLGMVIEKLCQDTYYNELKNRILKPLKLKNTIPSNKRLLRGLIVGYSGDKIRPFNMEAKVLVDGKYIINPQFEWTGGGLVSNSLDLAVWAKYLYEGRVLSDEMLKTMLQAVNTRTGQPNTAGYGLGVQIFKSPYGLIYGHGGIFPGYETQMLYTPKFKCGAAMQINADHFSGKLTKPIIGLLFEFLPIVEKYFGPSDPE